MSQAGGNATSGAYWVYERDGDRAGTSVEVYCDMEASGGGWTLVGKVEGHLSIYSVWLVAQQNADSLRNADGIEFNNWSSINAVEMAVDRAHQIRITNSRQDRWAMWQLPSGRDVSTWWNHGAGQQVIYSAYTETVTVHDHYGNSYDGCYQNVRGIMSHPNHGGSYPMTMADASGSSGPNDPCMAIGVLNDAEAANEFDQNGNGFDSPNDDDDWPNAELAGPNNVQVWLR